MSRRKFGVLMGIMAVVIGVLIGLNISAATRVNWDVSYTMANRGIEWTGAGYNGLFGR